MTAWAQEFCDAHQRAPGGLSIEVGTRMGGSACVFAELLWASYSGVDVPLLWTVDPYGSKPYVGGDTTEAPIYDDAIYLAMKFNLKTVPFHTHWLMESVDFFSRIAGMPYWRPGAGRWTGQDVVSGAAIQMPIGERRLAGKESATFILLDGEHSAEAIGRDVGMALFWLKPGGAIVVDNCDTDPDTVRMLDDVLDGRKAQTFCGVVKRADRSWEFSAGNQWCVIQKALVKP